MVRFHARNKLNIMKSTKITSQISAILIKPHINNMHQRILKALENIKTGTFRQIAIEKRFYCQNEKDIHLFGSNASFTFLKSKK